MIPVPPRDIDGTPYLSGVVSENSVCILNLTSLAVDYVNSLVNHSPGNVATKQGNKRLPLELWKMIIDWAEMDPKRDNYCLVQVLSLEQHGVTRTLACAKITEWNRCGDLKTDKAASEYCNYLRRPGEEHDPRRPFILPDTTNSDSLITVKLRPGKNVLFCRLKVYDVIARIEGGHCSFCQGKGRLDESEEDGGYRFYGYPCSPLKELWGDIDLTMECPLCKGLGDRPVYDGP